MDGWKVGELRLEDSVLPEPPAPAELEPWWLARAVWPKPAYHRPSSKHRSLPDSRGGDVQLRRGRRAPAGNLPVNSMRCLGHTRPREIADPVESPWSGPPDLCHESRADDRIRRAPHTPPPCRD